MKENLAQLKELQLIDIKISELENGKKNFPAQVENLKNETGTAASGLEKTLSSKAEMEEKQKGLYKEIEQSKEGLIKSQEKLNLIKTNREYDAIHEEIDTHQTRQKNAEAQMAVIRDDISKIDNELSQAKSKLDEIQQKNSPEIEKLETEVSQIDSKIGALVEKRDEIIKNIPVGIMRNYDRVLKARKNGKVLCFVGPDKRFCSNCCKSLTLQQVSEVRRATEIVNCDGCGSILIWEDNENGKN